MFFKILRSLPVTVLLLSLVVVMTEHQGQTAGSPAPVIDYQAADYVSGSTTWVNRATPGTGDGTLAAGGVSKTTSGEEALQFTGKAASNSDRVAGTIGSTSSVSSVSIEMWIKLKDDGSTQNVYGSMLFSWAGSPHYNIYHYKHGIGFNTISSEIYGINATSFVGQWKHIVFVMVKGGTAAQQKIYVNGIQQATSCNPVGNLASACDTSSVNSLRQFNANGDFILMDNGYSSNTWNAIADVGMVRIYKTELTASEVNAEFNESISNGYPDVVPPEVSSVAVPTTPSTTRNISYTYTFSESISGLAASDFTNAGTATGCTFAPAASTGITIRVDVSCSSDGTVIAKLAQNSVTDSASNTGPSTLHTASTVTLAVPVATTTIPAATTTVALTPTTSTLLPTTTVASTETTSPLSSPPSSSSVINQTSPLPTSSPVAQNKKTSATTTTVVQQPSTVQSATTTTTTTTTVLSTTTTVLSKIDVPDIAEGSAVLQIGGESVPVDITRRNNEVNVTAGSFTAGLQVIRADGTVSSLNGDGAMVASGGDSVRAIFSGLKPGSTVEVRMYSDPVLLGRTTVAASGSVTAQYEIPPTVPSGQHSFAVLGLNNEGSEISFFAPLQVRGDESGPNLFTVVIVLPILMAIGLAVFLPPFVRRRKNLL